MPKKGTHLFYSFLFQLITSPTCHGQTRTPTPKCQTQVALFFLPFFFFQKCLRKIRNDESPRTQTKGSIASAERELFGRGEGKKNRKEKKDKSDETLETRQRQTGRIGRGRTWDIKKKEKKENWEASDTINPLVCKETMSKAISHG